MEMSARDFSQYYSGSFVRRREDGKVFLVSDVGEGDQATLMGVGQTRSYSYSTHYSNVLREFDTFRFDLGWVWAPSVGYPVYMCCPAGHSYKKGHVSAEILWLRIKEGERDRSPEAFAQYKSVVEDVVMHWLDDVIADRAPHFNAAQWGVATDVLRHRTAQRVDYPVVINGTEWDSLYEFERGVLATDVPRRRRRPRGGVPEGMDLCRNLSNTTKILLLEAINDAHTLSGALRQACDHDAADKLCWRVDPLLAVLITPDSPINGANIFIGPTCIGEAVNGEVVLYDEYRPLFQPYIDRKLKEE